MFLSHTCESCVASQIPTGQASSGHETHQRVARTRSWLPGGPYPRQGLREFFSLHPPQKGPGVVGPANRHNRGGQGCVCPSRQSLSEGACAAQRCRCANASPSTQQAAGDTLYAILHLTHCQSSGAFTVCFLLFLNG